MIVVCSFSTLDVTFYDVIGWRRRHDSESAESSWRFSIRNHKRGRWGGRRQGCTPYRISVVWNFGRSNLATWQSRKCDTDRKVTVMWKIAVISAVWRAPAVSAISRSPTSWISEAGRNSLLNRIMNQPRAGRVLKQDVVPCALRTKNVGYLWYCRRIRGHWERRDGDTWGRYISFYSVFALEDMTVYRHN